MDSKKLQEIGEKLEVSQQDIRAIRRRKIKEFIIYPLTSVFFVLLSAFFGWFYGREHERLVSRETGGEYPYYTTSPGHIAQFCGLPIAVVTTAITSYAVWKRKGERKKCAIIAGAFTVIVTVIISIIVFTEVYRWAQPVEYYSGAIKYGVYSQIGEAINEQG
ncbi:MAG: hypothetical protein KAU14_07005 [Thermoplasmata archaeon]|nr:hypothetical protein [Thermoplasmata archaeon]